jgi:hypothetical protein
MWYLMNKVIEVHPRKRPLKWCYICKKLIVKTPFSTALTDGHLWFHSNGCLKLIRKISQSSRTITWEAEDLSLPLPPMPKGMGFRGENL